MASTKPFITLRAGRIQVSAFKFPNQNKNGETFNTYTTKITQSYKNKDNETIYGQFIDAENLLIVAQLTESIWRAITKEKENDWKAKNKIGELSEEEIKEVLAKQDEDSTK